MRDNKNVVKKVWDDCWNELDVSKKDFNLSKYRKILLNELRDELNNRDGHVNILNAGCGIDPIPLYILREYENVHVTIMDISQRCLELNKAFFKKVLSDNELGRIRYVTGDIFDMEFEESSFDIVYNTGVLEHFLDDERTKVLSEINRILKVNGLFITLNPSAQGRIYTYMKEYLENNGRWKYGPEYPIESLKEFVNDSFENYDIIEYNLDFQDSLAFLFEHNNPFISFSGRFYHILCRLDMIENISLKIFGGYILLTKIRKKQNFKNLEHS